MLVGIAAAAVVIAGAVYALGQRQHETASTPTSVATSDSNATTGQPQAGADSTRVVADAQPESTVRQAAAAPPTAPESNRTSTGSKSTSTTAPAPTRSSEAAPVDSTPAASTSVPVARLAMIQREVANLVSVGRQHVAAGDVDRARLEFRRAAQQVANVSNQFPNDPEVAHMRDSLAKALRATVQQCQAAIQRRALRVTEPGFRCPSLVPPRLLLGRGRPLSP